MTINRWFVHFGIPGAHERVSIDLGEPDGYVAMFEAIRSVQIALQWSRTNGQATDQ